ncbi:MAG: hypothetical protein BWY69_01032 [Planctomycetes bacterium ADurb.Bin401]|nr:MAG: hypothetical protein BWY69_01032 [Planctomycetes bacterium ADurb.Bin401]
MDNNKKLAENLLKADGIDPAQTNETEKKAFGKILNRQLKTKQSKQSKTLPNLWRIIMKSRITKFASAAIIIITAIITINYFDKTSVAWAQVVEQLNNHEKYKCRQRVVNADGRKSPTMIVYHMNLSLRRQEVEDGSVHVIDMRGKDAITVELDPAQKKAVITKLINFGPRKDPDIIDMVKRFQQESIQELGCKKQDGRLLYGFRHKPNQYNDYMIWVDAETKLPFEVVIEHPGRNTIYLDEFEFDFELEPSAFNTDIPQDYTVETLTQDYSPEKAKEITAQYIRNLLNHTAYTIENLSFMDRVLMAEITDPLGTKARVYVTGIKSKDGNAIVMVQGQYYDITKMVWIPKQQLVMETSDGIKLYTHPNGSIYAEKFLESLATFDSSLFNVNDLNDERFTQMIVMPNGAVLSLSANKKLSQEHLKEIVEALKEIKPD